MRIAEVQFTPWDKVYWFDPGNFDLKVGDKVVVQTELGIEMGKVTGLKELTEEELREGRGLKKIIRKANLNDLEKDEIRIKNKKEALDFCRQMILKHNLPMKVFDAHFYFDGGRVTFAFIAEGRIDFRQLVKDLTHHFQKSVRMHQIGVRDEAKYLGQFGPCGFKLCCQRFLKNLGQVSADYVQIQQVAHRGGERLSGVCGRLKCCLKYEQELYEELKQKLPALGTRVRTDYGRGVVVAQKILKQAVEVKLDGQEDGVVEVLIQ